jgi:hypothetical protein
LLIALILHLLHGTGEVRHVRLRHLLRLRRHRAAAIKCIHERTKARKHRAALVMARERGAHRDIEHDACLCVTDRQTAAFAPRAHMSLRKSHCIIKQGRARCIVGR